jgi:hypothetical protein
MLGTGARLNIHKSFASPLLSSLVFFTTFLGLGTQMARAQATSTATQALSLSAFGGATGTLTGLPADNGMGQGKNVGITAGVDLRIGHYGNFLPSIEVRGTYPFHKGAIDSVKNVVGGLRVEHPLLDGRLHPYADILFGRGEIDYQGSGYYVPSSALIYYYTVSNIFSPGLGMDIDVTHSVSLKLDAQFQHYDTPVSSSGSIYAKAATIGAVYHFDFNPHPRRR